VEENAVVDNVASGSIKQRRMPIIIIMEKDVPLPPKPVLIP